MRFTPLKRLPDSGWGTVYFGDAESRTSWWDKVGQWQLKLRTYGLFHAALLVPDSFLLTNRKFVKVHELERRRFGQSTVTALASAGVLVPAFRDKSFQGVENAYERFVRQGKDRLLGVWPSKDTYKFACEFDD